MDFPGICHIIKNTKISTVICSSQYLPTFISASSEVSCLHTIICMDSFDPEISKQTKAKIFTMKEVEDMGKENPSDFVFIKDDDLSTVIYTRFVKIKNYSI